MKRYAPLLICAALFPVLVPAQLLDPETAHTNLYFPHFADGGPVNDRWQTSILLLNPSLTSAVSVTLHFYDDQGRPLPLDLGYGLKSSLSLSIPVQGTKVLRSRMASPRLVTGWVKGDATLPVQATVLFRQYRNGRPVVELSTPAAQPTLAYYSIATKWTGVAVVNPSGEWMDVLISPADRNGNELTGQVFRLGPHEHKSFNLGALVPWLPEDFQGSILISEAFEPRHLLAWTLHVDRGLISTLPSGAVARFGSHRDRIWKVYRKVLDAATRILQDAGVLDLSAQPLQLTISAEKEPINAYASSDGSEIYVTISLAELINDSPSELAWVIGHELGHIVQARYGGNLFLENPELDADLFGMLVCLGAGYDPYAGAGTLAKLSMATDSGGLLEQIINDLFDTHQSYNTRIQNMFDHLEEICDDPQLNESLCKPYKRVYHPHFPDWVPLEAPLPGLRTALPRK